MEQIGTPEEIFHESNTRFVAEFMGDSDFLKGRVVTGGIQTEIGLLDQIVDLPALTLVEIALRADDIDFERDGSGNSLIVGRFFRGASNIYRLPLNSGQFLHALTDHTKILPIGTRVQAPVSAEHSLNVFFCLIPTSMLWQKGTTKRKRFAMEALNEGLAELMTHIKTLAKHSDTSALEMEGRLIFEYIEQKNPISSASCSKARVCHASAGRLYRMVIGK